jgi:cell division protein FtsW (lipid II flippase)
LEWAEPRQSGTERASRFVARKTELLLLLLCILFLGLCLLSLSPGSLSVRNGAVLLTLAFGSIFLAGDAALSLIAPECDELLLPLAALFSGFGLAFVARLQPELATRQLLWLAIGVGLMVLLIGPLQAYPRLRSYQFVAAFAGLALMLITAVAGKEINGSRLWLGAGGLYFQVTEGMKLLLVLFLAGYLADRRLMLGAITRRWRSFQAPALPYLVPLAIIWLITFGLMAWQRDLGAMMLLMAVTLFLLYAATGRISFVLGGVVMMLANVYLAYHLLSYIRLRVDVWLHPLTHVQDTGYQVAQSVYAFAAGGVFGTGLGRGYPGYIPAVHTDFIFAAIGEELGLAGTFGLLAAYVLFTFRGLRIALLQPTDYGVLLALGATATVALQSIIIMAGNLALIPITGITLPFVSYGGSSILANFVLLAMLLRLSTAQTLKRNLTRPI